MQFMLALVGEEETGWDAPPEEVDEMLAEMGAYNRKLAEARVMVDGAGLHPPDTAKTARFENGEAVITDGPFAEAKEYLAGYWIIQVESQQEALDWVKQVPIKEGKIEIREVNGYGEPIDLETFERLQGKGDEDVKRQIEERRKA